MSALTKKWNGTVEVRGKRLPTWADYTMRALMVISPAIWFAEFLTWIDVGIEDGEQ